MAVIADYQVNGLNPSTVGGLGTAIKYFPRILGTAGPTGGFSVNPSATNAGGQLVIPAFGEAQGQQVRVKLAGDVLPFTGGGTVQISLQANTGTIASPTYTTIASTGAVTLASATAVPWSLEAVLEGTNNAGATPGSIGGWYIGSLNNAFASTGGTAAPKALDAALTGLNFVTGQAVPTAGIVFGLVVGVTFSVSLAQNFARLYQFQAVVD